MRTYIAMLVAVLAVCVTGCGAYIPGSYAYTSTLNGREVTRVEGSYSYHHAESHVYRNTQIYPACVAEMGEMPGGREQYECEYEAVDRLRIRQMQRRMMVYPYYYGQPNYGRNPYYQRARGRYQPQPRYNGGW